ncbi:MAG: YgiT-type zinc finger protein [Planctomycetota bacterium]|jgi:YgiT-type zinc finger domain-containing protein
MEKNHQESNVTQRCKYCGCDTNEDVIKAAFWSDRGLTVIEDIPVQLCDRCGEQFFDEETTQRIQQLITHPVAKAKRKIQVPSYSMSKVTAKRKECYPESIRVNLNYQETFRCKYCESETVEESVKSAFWVDGELLAVENVPARVCKLCRQPFYDEKTADKITELHGRRLVQETPRRYVSALIFSLTDVEDSEG